MNTLRAGSTVTYKLRDDWGLGRVLWITPEGLLMVRFAAANYAGEFGALELEDASPLEVAV